jgi:hypothetical protein
MTNQAQPAAEPLSVGLSDFTLSLWIRIPERPSTGLGDVVSAFDKGSRRGLTLGFFDGSPCGNHGNDRELFIGLDAGTTPEWTDLGQPSPATLMVSALAVLNGELYAATWEGPPSDRGHVYRLEPQGWTDCGSPWDCNAVTRLAVYDGWLYAGVSRLRGGGSGMPDSANQEAGGRILRYEGESRWTDLGRLGDADSVAALVPFGGDLYAIPMYSEGLYRLVEPGRWAWCGSPGRRLLALGVHDGALYGAGNDHADVVSAIADTAAGIVVPARSAEGGGGVFRYEGGESWTSLGLQPDTTQVYSIETFDGAMHVGTWPNGLVYRHERDGSWVSCGRLGDETEVMNLLAFNGALYAGTLPRAQVFRMDAEESWAEVGRLDHTPDVLYRRAASMAVHDGALVVGTLPSGRVHGMRAGSVVSTGGAIGPGSHHVAAVREGPWLSLYVDGRLASSRSDSANRTLDLGDLPALTLGGGPRTQFAGEMRDPQLTLEALPARVIASLAAGPDRFA